MGYYLVNLDTAVVLDELLLLYVIVIGIYIALYMYLIYLDCDVVLLLYWCYGEVMVVKEYFWKCYLHFTGFELFPV